MIARPASSTSTPCTETFSPGTAGGISLGKLRALGFRAYEVSGFRCFGLCLVPVAALKAKGVSGQIFGSDVWGFKLHGDMPGRAQVGAWIAVRCKSRCLTLNLTEYATGQTPPLNPMPSA